MAQPQPALPRPSEPLLSVSGLTVDVPVQGAFRPAVDAVTFRVFRGESVAIAGESGCGKTLLARALVNLPPDGVRIRGEVLLGGSDLLTAPRQELRRVRGGRIGFLFQEPASAFDPVRTVGDHLVEAIRLHRRVSRSEAGSLARSRLREVAFGDADRGFREYPHRLSGGQKQRALLAIALAADPEILIADEPTTALDATVAAEVLELLAGLRLRRGLTLLLVTHDLGLVARHSDRAIVLYAGRIVEEGPTPEIFLRPRHPYTRGLLASAPRLGGGWLGGARLQAIPGSVPDLPDRIPDRCGFASRCPERFEPCERRAPEAVPDGDVSVRCFLYAPQDSAGAAHRSR